MWHAYSHALLKSLWNRHRGFASAFLPWWSGSLSNCDVKAPGPSDAKLFGDIADSDKQHSKISLRGQPGCSGEINYAMAGQAKTMLDSIIQQRAKGNPILIQTLIGKLILKGLDPDRFKSSSPDDPRVIEKIRAIATEFGVKV